MQVGDLVSIEIYSGKSHAGIVVDLYDEKDIDGEAQILWDDGKIQWERIAELQHRAEEIYESR